jgi:hypothetical protein
MKHSFVFTMLTVLFFLPLPSHAQRSGIPNAILRVTVQQKEEGKLEQGLHILELFCGDGHCSLTSVSLNQCGQSGEGKPAFYPKVQRSSTREGNLAVRNEGRTLVVQETGSDIGGDYVNNFRFQYAAPTGSGITARLIGFSGGFVKNSFVLQKVLTIEYVPLPRAHQVVQLDCGVLLPGIDRQ